MGDPAEVDHNSDAPASRSTSLFACDFARRRIGLGIGCGARGRLARKLQVLRCGGPTHEVRTVRRINHRELRNSSSSILRDVAAGEIIEVTNHGEVAAILVPPSLTPFEVLVAAGKVRLPSSSPAALRLVNRSKSRLTSAEIIATTRGER